MFSYLPPNKFKKKGMGYLSAIFYHKNFRGQLRDEE